MRRICVVIVLFWVGYAEASPKNSPQIICTKFGCKPNSVTSIKRRSRSRSLPVSMSGVVPELANKIQQIVGTCGSKVISAVRRTRIAGTRRISLHAYGRAVDLRGNPACINRLLARWPGGVSTDYYNVRPPHTHVSYDPQGREWGLRFMHRRVSKRNIFRRYTEDIVASSR